MNREPLHFEFATAQRIIFGPGVRRQAAGLVEGYGRRAFVLTGSQPERAGWLLEALAARGIEAATFSVPAEPTVSLVQQAVAAAEPFNPEVVVGLGGGSTVDTGKAVAALLANGGDPLDYLEVVGQGRPLTRPSRPYVALPTTAGTGAEVTKNAVLDTGDTGVKVSMRSPFMLPACALVDPELTHGLPRDRTAATGLDALTQLLEAFVTHKANPLTDGYCREGLHRVARSLRRVYRDGSDAAAREDISLAALLSGLSLANAGLGAVHGFAGPLGGMLHAPHGTICARFLPEVMDSNIAALRNRDAGSDALVRYEEVAHLLTQHRNAHAEDGVAWVRELVQECNMPGMKQFGLTSDRFPEAVDKARKASSMKGNPVELTDEELVGILEHVL